jgi:hypothetical protein
LKARERGDGEQADQLAAQAAQYLDRAAAFNPPSASPQPSEHVTQQQQQLQADDTKKE